jgi:hypothetical protein
MERENAGLLLGLWIAVVHLLLRGVRAALRRGAERDVE